MKRIVNTNIRFDLSREDDRQAYEYLRCMDRTKFKSYTRAVVAAINDFFSRQEKIQADPFLETREKEDRFLEKVLDTITDGISQGMGNLQNITPAQPVQPDPQPENTGIDEEDFENVEAFLKDMGL